MIPTILTHPTSYTSNAERPVRIALLDTGMDLQHDFLKGHIWSNLGEVGLDKDGKSRATNGIDDDGNGYVDDAHGWNFAQRNADVSDLEGHGTHIAGVIKNAASANDLKPNFEIIVLKYYGTDKEPRKYKDSFSKALDYALKMQADVINISGGGTRFSEKELELFRLAEKRGVIVVAAAGNKAPKNPDLPFYPAAYSLKNIFSVVATNHIGKILDTSNVNQAKQNVLAKGFKIYSSLPGNQFGFRTGSSQAAAYFTGEIVSQFHKIGKSKHLDLYNYINNSRL